MSWKVQVRRMAAAAFDEVTGGGANAEARLQLEKFGLRVWRAARRQTVKDAKAGRLGPGALAAIRKAGH